MLTNYKIYFLSLKGSQEVKYIGLTKNNLEKRLYYHYITKGNNKNRNWVKKNWGNVEINLLEEYIFTYEEACQKEIEYISLYKSLGAELNNLTIGGDGTKGIKAWNKGKKTSDEQKLKLSLAHKGKKLSEETKKKMSESRKGIIFTDERKKNISEGKKNKPKRIISEEGRKKLCGRTPWNKGIVLTEEEKEKFKKSHGKGICKCKHHQK